MGVRKGLAGRFHPGRARLPLIRTGSYRDYHAGSRTRASSTCHHVLHRNERVDLPAQAANQFADLVQASKDQGRFERDKRSCAVASGRTSSALSGRQLDAQAYAQSVAAHRRPSRGKEIPEMREKLYEARPMMRIGTVCLAGSICRTCGARCTRPWCAWKASSISAAAAEKAPRGSGYGRRDEVFLHNGALQRGFAGWLGLVVRA